MDSGVSRAATDAGKLAHFVQGNRSSDRVKESVKEKSADELLVHYGLAREARASTLTRLGVLLQLTPRPTSQPYSCCAYLIFEIVIGKYFCNAA